jgi:hypothetical protein
LDHARVTTILDKRAREILRLRFEANLTPPPPTWIIQRFSSKPPPRGADNALGDVQQCSDQLLARALKWRLRHVPRLSQADGGALAGEPGAA